MKRSLVTLCLLTVCGAISAQTDKNISKVQSRLKAEGCYYANPTGIFDIETVAALRRYQLRHGLTVSGKLDAPTTRYLNASAPTPAPTPQALTGTWQRLPNGEMQFVQPPATPSPAVAIAPTVPSVPPPAPRLQPAPPAEGPATPAPVAENRAPSPAPPPPATVAQPHRSPSGGTTENPDRLRDYVEAFVQAGLAQPLGSEVKFFAERVDYFGAPDVPRQQVQRDLVRYDQKWPHRHFWIDGDIQIEPQSGRDQIKLVFPLRYELRNGSRHASGKVLKSLTLLKTANDEMQITAVNEWKAP